MLSAGTRLGPYEIESPLGAGGMGEVYKARDTRLDRIVAIKVSQEKFSERFEREARAVAALNHPHICQLYDVGSNYLVMEFVAGAPLQGPLPLEKAVEFAGQLLDALDAAHRRGITHRDLKPGNILVTKTGIKLLDFGLAKQSAPVKEADTTLTAALTSQGQILGTLQYMSPEQLQGREADPRSDLFSFGCVLYEMLTGKRAFDGHSAASVIAAILEREPAPMDAALPLDRVLRRSLAKDPDQRFQTARDLKAALTWALDHPPASRGTKPDRRWWLTIAAALALAAVGGWALGHFPPPAGERVLRLEINPPPGGRFVFGGATVGGLAVAPDGKTVAFVASVNGKTGLWLRPLDGTAARRVPGTEGAGFPFWSPDSKSIGLFVGGKMQRVDLGGEAPVPICDGIQMRGGAWGSDGYILFGTLTSGLFRVSASGGMPSPVTTLDTARGEVALSWPQLLPGGRFLYWTRGSTSETGIYGASFAKPAERIRLLTTDTHAIYAPTPGGKGYLLWRRGGALLAQELNPDTLKFAGEPRQIAEAVSGSLVGLMTAATSAGGLLLYSAFRGATQFTWFDRTGKPLGIVGEPVENNFMFRLSRDARHIVVQRNTAGVADIWLLDADRGLPSRLTVGTGRNTYPIWSPDGRIVMFGRLGSGSLFRKDASGVSAEQVVIQRPGGVTLFPTDWSGDGRWVLEQEFTPETNKYDLTMLPMTPDAKLQDGAKPKRYSRTPFNTRNGRFSPEPSPRWVAYESDESGQSEIYVDAFPDPRGKKQISTAGGTYPQWGAGGRELFYVSPDFKLMTVSLKLGTDSVEPSAPHELFTLPALASTLSPYEATPDGQRFMVLANQDPVSQPLSVIVNWSELLKKAASQ
jgi:Tol biopolymer transport system component/predicted Ser/Thr protein kinase